MGGDIEQVELKFKRFVGMFAVAEDLLFDMDVSVNTPDFFGHQVVVQVTAKILTDSLPPEHFTARQQITYEVPSSVWQMWKQRHAGRWYAAWLVRRRPVRYEPDPDGRGTTAVCTFDLARYRTYPRARVQLPADSFGTVVYNHQILGPWWRSDGE
jgi:hypothetical protein